MATPSPSPAGPLSWDILRDVIEVATDAGTLARIARVSRAANQPAIRRLYTHLDISGPRLHDLLRMHTPQPPANAYNLQLYKWRLATRYYLPMHEHQRRALALVRSLNIRNISRPALEALYAAAASTPGVPLFPNVEKVHVYGRPDGPQGDQGVLPAPDRIVLFPSTAHLCAWWTDRDGATGYPPNFGLFPTQPPQSVIYHQPWRSNTTEICPFKARLQGPVQVIYFLEDYGQSAYVDIPHPDQRCIVCGGRTVFNARDYGGTLFSQAW
ncbi:uncharacterized protein LOC62_01G001032 [Vanrija pseudolonga]|uniref:F-box domain-containing protein n=1 Tax=Vanrija pseudolonga TaxID=143232 RepID=A0AAF0Y644_9TREE|nr:hypothetical protein LOC62_01G001032 [Vanrija pseudolonga]